MENSKRKSNGKRLMSVLLAAMLIGSATVATSSYTGVGISASAVTDTAKTSASDFEYSMNDDGTVTITKYNGNDIEITIPSEIDGMTVKEIGKNAFMDGRYTSITIPSSVTKIDFGIGQFVGQFRCYKLNSINVDKDNPVYSSKDGVLFSKDGTKLLFYPLGKEATASVFDGVKEIGDYAFLSFYKFNYTDSTLTIPDSVEVIGESAFMGCSLPEKLILGKNVRSIGKKAFWTNDVDRIKEVTIPENVDFIGLMAFETVFANWTKENTTFNGYTGSYADLYCKAYGYKFVSIGTAAEKPELTNGEFGIKVKGSFPDGATLSVKEGTSKLIPDPVFFYNISLNKDSKEVQPTGFVTVSIPCDVENCVVYYEDAENNTLTDMNAIYLDGCYVFAINHFSDYVIVPNGTQISANVIQPSFEATNSSKEPSVEPSTEPLSNPEQSSKDEPSKTTENSSTQQTSENSETTNNSNTGTTNTPNTDTPATADSGIPAFMVALLAAISGITAVIFAKRKKSEQ